MTSERDRIVGDLESADEEIRRLAVERLSELPAREAVPRLVESLGDASWRVRKAAVERLVDSPDADRVADALIEALADGENPGRRNSAAEALMACGAPVVPRLVRALAADDSDVRKLLVDTLAGIGDLSSRPQLIASLRDPDANVRAAAADALGVLAGDDAASALRSVAAREGEDRLVRFSALRALARFECPIPSDELLAVASDPVLRPAAFALLGYSEDAGAEDQLLKGLGMASRANREAAVEALLSRLSRLDGAAADALASRVRQAALAAEGLLESAVLRLSEADLSVRLTWVQFLGLVGSPACVVPILESACDEAVAEVAQSTLEALGEVAEEALTEAWPRMDRALRRRACALLARTPGALANARLREALDDPDTDLRTAAARALGARRAADALPNLLRRLEAAALDEEPESEEEVEAIVEALVAIASDGPDPAARVLAGLAFHLESGIEPIRRAAAGVLTRIARPEDADALSSLLRDPSAAVRRLAVAGLGRLDPSVAAEPLRLALADESPLVRAVAATTLGASRADSAFEDLQRLLADDDPRVAGAAVRAIGASCAGAAAGRPGQRARALARLGEAIRQGPGPVAMAAIEALDAMGGADAAAVAVSALDRGEPELLQAAVACVGRHADADGLSALIPAVQDPNWAVRGEVIQTLADRRFAMALPAILRRLESERDSFVRDVIVRALRRLEE